jgi:PAS domain S-box-containing protein
MEEGYSGGEERTADHPARAVWIPNSYVFALAFGIALVGGLTAYAIHSDYRTALTFWNSRLSVDLLDRTWILETALLQSQDDAHVLADSTATKDLLLHGRDGGTTPIARAALLKQLTGLFDDYRRVYEYAAVCLLDHEGQVVAQATGSKAWEALIQSGAFKGIFRAVSRSGEYSVHSLQTPGGERALIFGRPVFANGTTEKRHGLSSSSLGVVAILDPVARGLDPLFKAEHVTTHTGETLLLQLQHGEGQYASPRRFSGTAHLGASRDTLKRAVSSALEDRALFGQFLDYRGVAVLAAMQKVPSLSSVVVCKLDRGEALADFRRTAGLKIMAGAAILLVYVGVILGQRRNAMAREMKARLAQQQAILAERARTEALLRTVNETLEAKVEERTAQWAKTNEHLRLELEQHERAKQALEASEQRYRDLIENAGDIIYTHDLQGNFTSLNKAGERYVGYRREEILGTNIVQMVAPESRELVPQLIQPAHPGPEANTYELEAISKQGKRLTLEVRPRVIYEDGRPTGVQGIARDLTERKRLEQQFRQAQKMEAVGRLAGGIAHDFNNLLTIILGYCDVAFDQLPGGTRLGQALEEIAKAGKRAAALTAQLLAFSRRHVLVPQVLDLNTVVSDMDRMLRRLIGEDVNLTSKLGGSLGRVKADRGQIEQVILNLAVNARDAMPQGGSLSIETANVDSDEVGAPAEVPVKSGRYVMFTMSDTGHGMNAEAQAHLFEPFFTTKEPGKGTGLGLATVYGIVKQAGGYVWAQSAPKQGALFKVLVPRIDEVTSGPTPDPRPGELPPGTETILLVEDEEMVRLLLRQILERTGYKVLEARRGSEGLETCERTKEPIHLLLTDVIMPQMSGAELARRLAASHPETRVLYISGYTDGTLSGDGVVPEDAAFLQKPFTPEVLVKKVREVLDLNPVTKG